MPVLSPIEDIKKVRERLNRMAEEIGRDPSEIKVLAFGWPGTFRTRQEIDELERAGVDHVTIWLTEADRGEKAVCSELEALAKEVR